MSPGNKRGSSRGARSRSGRYPKLRPGPGRSAEDVAAHQRERLRKAMVELAAEHGYSGVSVARLARCARVSKRDFYKHFASKEECVLATYDAIVEASARGIVLAAEDEEDWRQWLRQGFRAFARQVADNPEAARLALIEVVAVGPIAADRVRRTNQLFESLIAGALTGRSVRLPRLLVKGIVAACARVARARLLSGSPRQLVLDADGLIDWSISVCDETAVRLRDLGLAKTPRFGAAAEISLGEVRPGDERALIMAATERLARSEGLATLTVPRVRAAAGVSKNIFDTHFAGVADCFLTTLGALSGRALAIAEPSFFTADSWASGVHRMIADLGRCLAGDPNFAGLAFLDAFSPDPVVIRWRAGMIIKLAAMLRREAPLALRPNALSAEASVGAMWGVIHHFVDHGRGAHLPVAVPVLSYFALAPALGGPAAVDAIFAEVGRGDRNRFA